MQGEPPDDLDNRRISLQDNERILKRREDEIARKRKILNKREALIRAENRKPIMIVVIFIVFALIVVKYVSDNYVIYERGTKNRTPESNAAQAISQSAGFDSPSIQNDSEFSPRQIHVPSDPNAQFFVLETAGNGAMRTITTKRVSAQHTSYSKRAYNCNDSTVMYIGTGDSLDAMNQSAPDAAMGPIVNESIAYYVGLEACR